MPDLLNLRTGEFESSSIASPIESQDLDCYRNEWQPIIHAKLEELKQAGPLTHERLRDAGIEDFHWRWPDKCRVRAGELRWHSLALRTAERTQGLMFLDLLRRSRGAEGRDHLVYIDLLATAPWNRKKVVADAHYKGVGVVLFTEAILISQAEGFLGRIGLHSLHGATSFYEHTIGMTNYGPDPDYQGLPYLEMTQELATKFLAE